MTEMSKIFRAVADGELTFEEANIKLEEAGYDVRLVKDQNKITDEEKAANIVDDDPSKVTGWGVLDMGIGSPDKIYVENGKFSHDTGFDETSVCYFIINDRTYRVIHDHIEVYEG